MPVKVMWQEGGPYAICDTAAEAAELLKFSVNGTVQASTKALPQILESNKGSGPIGDQALVEFFAGINRNAKTFLSTLANHPEGITGEDFATETGFGSEKFGGVLGGASKIAKKHGFAFEKFVVSEMRTEGVKRYRFLKPGPLLLRNAARLKEGR